MDYAKLGSELSHQANEYLREQAEAKARKASASDHADEIISVFVDQLYQALKPFMHAYNENAKFKMRLDVVGVTSILSVPASGVQCSVSIRNVNDVDLRYGPSVPKGVPCVIVSDDHVVGYGAWVGNGPDFRNMRQKDFFKEELPQLLRDFVGAVSSQLPGA